MKKLFFIFTLFFLYLRSSGQIKYSAETKRFIDYDTSVIVFQHALLIDGTGSIPKPNQTLIIKSGKIDWVGDDSKAIIPKKSQSINLTGKTIMPGLVMLHEHMYIAAGGLGHIYVKPLPITFPRLYLAAGATTIRTAGCNEPYLDKRIKLDIESGFIPGPLIELTAPYLEGRRGVVPQMNRLLTPEEAVQFVNYWADQGFTSFKAYMWIEKNILKAAIDAAHKRGAKVTGHLCSITSREAAELGIDQLEHGFMASSDFAVGKKENECPPAGSRNTILSMDPSNDSVRSLIQFLVAKKVILTSTLQVFEGFTTTQPLPDRSAVEAMAPDTRDYYLKNLVSIKSAKAPTSMDRNFPAAARLEKIFNEAGGLLTVGTDPTGNGGGIAGYGNWRSIELLVLAGGFSPVEAIKIATFNGAKALGMEKTKGTIQAGKDADLLVIDGDPSKNISDIRKVVWVFKDGVGFNSKRMFESVKGKVGFH